MNEKELIEDFKNCGALLEGHFILSSGLHSTKYLQCALALSNPILAKKITKALGEKIINCLLYTSPSPRDLSTSRMPSSA